MNRLSTVLLFHLFLLSSAYGQQERFQILLTNHSVPITVDTFLFSDGGVLLEYREAMPKSRPQKANDFRRQRRIVRRTSPSEGAVLRIDSTFVEWADGRIASLTVETTTRTDNQLVITIRDGQRIRSRKAYMLDENSRPYRLEMLTVSGRKGGGLTEETKTYVYEWEDGIKASITDSETAKRKYKFKALKKNGNFFIDNFTGRFYERTTYMFNASGRLRSVAKSSANQTVNFQYHNSGLVYAQGAMSTDPKATVASGSTAWRIKKDKLPKGLPRPVAERAAKAIIEHVKVARSDYRLLFPELLPAVNNGNSR